MNAYDRAAFGFSKAYDMNMRAADEQRRVNRPSTEAFVEELDDERTDLTTHQTLRIPLLHLISTMMFQSQLKTL